ncbi:MULTISPECIES: DinB family protein [unclassified Pedobacter]|uniref:DinB family protein n=1 Tax=unclassified Pedobacter TaxID=2628915 RepID=UPI001D2924AD|nr:MULTISPECIES: DUF1572 family protein [unclassified Pedobacter]CAH0160675.1 hypothetical protein SRABI36_01011 [Pedobacter sp. Bi36]CAH0216553.1 hypothetical protein SRABI126_02102 [Pedobacter sp. Bi126]
MLTETLKTLFNRDLNKLKSEIESYKNDANLWIIDKSIANSAGNLCLHLIGNINTYIGATLGGSNYIRNRELEFSLKNVPKQELINMIEATIIVVNETVGKITEEQLNSEYRTLVFQEKTSTEFFLVHLTTHLAYHLGQINYHRRLLDDEL